MDHSSIEHTEYPVVKAAVAWFGVGLAHLGINTWSDAAAVAATIYTLLLIADWIWKKKSKAGK